MPRPQGRPRNEELVSRRREEILSVAAQIFAQRGYPGTDVQEVADACGLAKGTIYVYFPSKECLFLASVDRAMVLLREAIMEASSSEVDPLLRIAAAIRAYLTYFRTFPAHAELLIIERAEFRERKTPTYLEHRRANVEQWREVYAKLIDAGRLRKVPIDRILNVIGDLLYGTMFTNHFTGHSRNVDDQVRDVLDILFFGLLTESERAHSQLDAIFRSSTDEPLQTNRTG